MAMPKPEYNREQASRTYVIERCLRLIELARTRRHFTRADIEACLGVSKRSAGKNLAALSQVLPVAELEPASFDVHHGCLPAIYGLIEEGRR